MVRGNVLNRHWTDGGTTIFAVFRVLTPFLESEFDVYV